MLTDLCPEKQNSTFAIRISESQLPNIVGANLNAFFYNAFDRESITDYGAFYYYGDITNNFCPLAANNDWSYGGWSFVASRYNSRYGGYTEVNPLYESCLFYIKF